MGNITVADATPCYVISPLNYGATVGTTSIAAVPFNSLRTGITFHNPNATALLAFAPGTAIIGSGSLTLLSHETVTIQGVHMTAAFQVISDTPGSAYTLWEYL